MTAALLLLVFALAVFALWVIVRFHAVVQQQQQLTEAWKDVDEAIISRNRMLSDVQEFGKAHGMEAHAPGMDQLRDLIAKDIAFHPELVRPRAALQQAISQQAAQLMAQMAQHPQIHPTKEFQAAQGDFVRLEQAYLAAAGRYNTAARVYNQLLKTPPNSWVAERLGFVPAPLAELARES